MLSRRNFLKFATLGATGTMLGTAALQTVSPAYAGKAEVFTGLKQGYGAGGYDVVSYFTQSKPVEGTDQFETTWQGAKWAFSSQENLDKFKAEPTKYAPQYGGYCAFAVSKGATAKGDPHAWTVHKGKLYLNYNKQVRTRWQSNPDGHIESANQNWPKVLN